MIFLSRLHEVEPGMWPVCGIEGTTLFAEGIGAIKITRKVDNKITHGTLNNVLFVPNLGVTLISIASITNNGMNVSFSVMNAKVTLNNQTIKKGQRTGETLYQIDATPVRSPSMGLTAASHTATLNIRHQRMGHLNEKSLTRMASGIGVTGMVIKPGGLKLDDCCDGCHLGKMHKLHFSTSTSRPNTVGELVVSDIVGPIQETSVGGARYYILFKDVFSGFKVVFFLKLKSETLSSLMQYVNRLQTETGQ